MKYIQDEWRNKKRGGPEPNWNDWDLIPTQPSTLTQHNGVDCALFMSYFVDLLSLGLPLNISQTHINAHAREKYALSIMNNQLIK